MKGTDFQPSALFPGMGALTWAYDVNSCRIMCHFINLSNVQVSRPRKMGKYLQYIQYIQYFVHHCMRFLDSPVVCPVDLWGYKDLNMKIPISLWKRKSRTQRQVQGLLPSLRSHIRILPSLQTQTHVSVSCSSVSVPTDAPSNVTFSAAVVIADYFSSILVLSGNPSVA